MQYEQTLDTLKQMIANGEDASIGKNAKEALAQGMDPLILIDELSAVLRQVGDKFSRNEIFLPEMMLSAEAFKAAMEVLKPKLLEKKAMNARRGKVVMGTSEGDLHDIGKNIVATMLQCEGFDVYDIGVDAPAKKFIEKAEEVGADIIAASALMSSSMTYQQDILSLLRRRGLRSKYKVMVGGGPVTPDWKDEIGADGYGKDSTEAVRVAKKLLSLT